MHECDSVPQWYCGQQFPATVAWTRARPGAQLTEDSGHRLTSQTAPTHETKRKLDLKKKHTHGSAHTCSQTGRLTTVVMRTAAVGVVDVHSHYFSA